MDLRRFSIRILSIFLRLWTALLFTFKRKSKIPKPLEFLVRIVLGHERLTLLEFLSDIYSSYGLFAYEKIIYITDPAMAQKGMEVLDKVSLGAVERSNDDIATDSRHIAMVFLRRPNVESKKEQITKVIDKAVKKLQDSTVCNISSLMLKMAIDIHGQVLLGLDLRALDDQQNALIDTLSAMTRRTFVFREISPVSQEFRYAALTLANLCDQMLKQSQEECGHENTLANRLQVCGIEEARIRLQVLFITGVPVMGIALSMMLHLLAGKAVLQRELRQEADEWIENSKQKVNVSGSPPKIESAIKEFLRCHPVTAFVSCKASDAVKVGNYPIKRGSDVRIFIWGMHRSPRLWSNAKEYCYDRFMKTRPSSRTSPSSVQSDQGSWMPFADGSGTCMGQHMAFYELVLSLAFLLRHFTFFHVAKTEEPKICMDWAHGICHLESDIILGIQKRSDIKM